MLYLAYDLKPAILQDFEIRHFRKEIRARTRIIGFTID